MIAREPERPRIGHGQRPVPNETWPKGRRCKTCECFLSVYNPGKRCWPHDFGDPAPAERVTKVEPSPADRLALAAASFGLSDLVAA